MDKLIFSLFDSNHMLMDVLKQGRSSFQYQNHGMLNKSGKFRCLGINCVLDGVTAKSLNKYLSDINHMLDPVTFCKLKHFMKEIALCIERKERKNGKT